MLAKKLTILLKFLTHEIKLKVLEWANKLKNKVINSWKVQQLVKISTWQPINSHFWERKIKKLKRRNSRKNNRSHQNHSLPKSSIKDKANKNPLIRVKLAKSLSKKSNPDQWKTLKYFERNLCIFCKPKK